MTNPSATPWAVVAAAAFAAFLLGSIPFAVIIGRLNGVDIRTTGSQNAGATNLGRALGFKYFLACFLLDAAKGFVPVFAYGIAIEAIGLASLSLDPLAATLWFLVVVAAVAGHMYSPWIGFRGGKGVATGLGAVLGIFPALTIPGIGALVVFLGVLWVWRYVSLASILGAASLPVWVWYFFRLASTTLAKGPDSTSDRPIPLDTQPTAFVVATAVIAALIIYKHRSNIERLSRNEEPKVGHRDKTASASSE